MRNAFIDVVVMKLWKWMLLGWVQYHRVVTESFISFAQWYEFLSGFEEKLLKLLHRLSLPESALKQVFRDEQ